MKSNTENITTWERPTITKVALVENTLGGPVANPVDGGGRNSS